MKHTIAVQLQFTIETLRRAVYEGQDKLLTSSLIEATYINRTPIVIDVESMVDKATCKGFATILTMLIDQATAEELANQLKKEQQQVDQEEEALIPNQNIIEVIETALNCRHITVDKRDLILRRLSARNLAANPSIAICRILQVPDSHAEKLSRRLDLYYDLHPEERMY